MIKPTKPVRRDLGRQGCDPRRPKGAGHPSREARRWIRKIRRHECPFGIEDSGSKSPRRSPPKKAKVRRPARRGLPDQTFPTPQGTHKVLAIVYSADGAGGHWQSTDEERQIACKPTDDGERSKPRRGPPKGFARYCRPATGSTRWSDTTDALRGRIKGDRLEVAKP